MNTLTAIEKRRSARRYSPEMPERELIEKVLLAGRQAPSGGNCQLNHFLVIGNREIMERLAVQVAEEFSRMECDENTYKSLRSAIMQAKKGGYVYDYHAPVLIVVCNKTGHGNAMADASCALQNMMLAATELRLGSCWINQLRWLREQPGIRRTLMELGMAEDETVCGALAVGYADDTDREGPKITGNRVTWIL